MKKSANLIHSLFCQKDHLQKMEDIKGSKSDPTKCLFYLEQVIAGEWEQRDHLEWLANTEKLMQELNISSPAELYNVISKCLAITRAASSLVEQNIHLKVLLVKLIQAM